MRKKMNSRDQIVLFKPQYSSLKIINKKKVRKLTLFMKMRKTFHRLLLLNKYSQKHIQSIYHWVRIRTFKSEIIKYKKNYITP